MFADTFNTLNYQKDKEIEDKEEQIEELNSQIEDLNNEIEDLKMRINQPGKWHGKKFGL